jgi:hypothetical protein
MTGPGGSRPAATAVTRSSPALWPARAGYLWNNSPAPLLQGARRTWDRSRRAALCVTSEPRDGHPVLGYAGLAVGETNVLQLMEHQRDALAGPTVRRRRGRVAWRDLPDAIGPEADLLLIAGEREQIARLPAERSLIAPLRVHLVVEVDPDPGRTRLLASKRERWQFGRDRERHGWTLERDDSPEAFAYFYERMHVPTMRVRHAEQSRTEDAAVAYRDILRHGCLFFVVQDGRRVSGALCRWSPDGLTLTTRLLGVLDGDSQYYDSGAFKAVYHLLLEWASGHSVRRVDFFGTEAFLSKGIFQWKRRLGPGVELPPNHFAGKRLYLAVRRDTPEVRDLLVANPLLVFGPDGGLEPVYFTDALRPARLDFSAKCRGVGEPRVIDLDRFLGSSVPGSSVPGSPGRAEPAAAAAADTGSGPRVAAD